MKKIILILLFVILVLMMGCKTIEPETQEVPVDESKEEVGFAGITEQQCKEANGYWNECGSPCAGTDAEMCIQVCQAQCECGGIAGFSCPQGYKCRLTGKIMDEMGVCVKG